MGTDKEPGAIGRCRSGPWAVPSGILAFGNEVIGHPAHPDASRTFTTEDWVSACSALSRSQIETHATKIHMKLIGSNAAINLLNGGVNIPNIIHSGFVLCHSVSADRGQLRRAAADSHRAASMKQYMIESRAHR